MKNWKSHALIGMKAVESLPGWEKELLPSSLSGARRIFSFIPEFAETPPEIFGAMCLIMDQVYDSRYRQYCLLPDGRWIPHTVPDGQGCAAFQSGESVSHAKCSEILEYLLERMFASLEAADMMEAAARGGVLGHFLQDAVAPSHAVNMRQMRELMPDPVAGRHLSLGKYFYAACGRFESVPPMLAGTTLRKAACRLTWEIMKSVRRARGKIIPLMEAAYEDAPVEKCEEILIPQVRDAAWLTASAWHTVFSIRKNRIPEAEKEKLKNQNLIEIEPCFLHPGKYTELLPGKRIESGYETGLRIFAPDGSPVSAPVNSFAMTGHSAVKFHIGPGVYSRFECLAGITADGQSPANLVFSIETDRRENTVYSEDMNYGSECVASARLIPGAPPVKLCADVREAKTLLLCARSFPMEDGAGNSFFSIPDIILCEPTLYGI